MKRTLALAVAAQLLAVTVFAQSADQTGDQTGDQTADTDTIADAAAGFGSDWSTSLGIALFSEDGTTLRPQKEITTQWQTLSDEDKAVIRRDCMAFMQVPGDTGAPAAQNSPENGTAATTDTTTSALGASPMMNVTAAQMEEICAATKDL